MSVILIYIEFRSKILMKKVKYAEVAPWDGGPNQTHTNDPEWIMQKGIIEVSFSRNQLDHNYFHIRRGEKDLTSKC